MKKYDILIVIDHYLPGRLSGGPVTAISNLTHRLDGKMRFLIVTRNYDINGTVYSDIIINSVYRVNGADVIYLPSSQFNPGSFRKYIKKYEIPVLYLNSFFSVTTIRTLICERISSFNLSIILAPRGEFSLAALALKRRKKRLYLNFFRVLGLSRSVATFQASTVFELRDIYRTLGPVFVKIAVDLAPLVNDIPKTIDSGGRRVVFISRVSPMKNLLYAIEVLKRISIPFDFHIYGPLEDQAYWEKCKHALEELPKHIHAEYKGVVPYDQVHKTLNGYDVFLFPTLGENYGHVIWESLAAGCPVVLSDQTSWQDFRSAGVGDVLPLSEPQRFADAVQALLQDSPEHKLERAAACQAYAKRVAEDHQTLQENLDLLQTLSR